MYCSIASGAVQGINGVVIQVEVDVSEGFPKFDLVGMASGSVKEAIERVRTSIKNMKKVFPYKRITINLAPAHIRKEGTAYDLPIAIGILTCQKEVSVESVKEMLIVGELTLDGRVRPIRGLLGIIEAGRKAGYSKFIIPKGNEKEAGMIKNIEVYAVETLLEATKVINERETRKQYRVFEHESMEMNVSGVDFADVYGQKQAKRGIEIGAAGFHHIMMSGPPGTGKTMLGSRLITILPKLSYEEKIQLTKIYSASELLLDTSQCIEERPFRNPHHTITRASFTGGGIRLKPGEVSLAHLGVLMLDEFLEFPKDVIESLRQPLEAKHIILSKNQMSYSYPSKFLLVASMNPCPCGYYPDSERCNCSPLEIKKYQKKLSGPILDRMDVFLHLNRVSYKDLENKKKEESSKEIRERVIKIYELQKERYKNETYNYNSEIPVHKIATYCRTTDEAKRMLKSIYENMSFSTRSYYRLLRLARTIGDIEHLETIDVATLSEAITYRKKI